MTLTPKQWTMTGFLIGILSGVAVAVAAFYTMRGSSNAVAQPVSPAAAMAPVSRPVSTPASAAVSSSPLISGTIDLDPSARVALPAVVFVIARTEGQGKGHPVLAKRLEVQSFPVTFTLASTDAMMDQAPPDHVLLEARVDLDGDAMTRDAGAAMASMPSVPLGVNGVKLMLK